MKKLLIGLAVLAGIALIAILLVPVFVPKDALEERIERAASDAVGRGVTIDGAPDVSIFPTKLGVRGLTVANAEGFDAPYLLRVDEARIGVKLLPLLSGRIEMTRFDLDRPDINLQARPDGDANWVLTPPEPEEPSGPLPDIRLGTVSIEDATVRYDGGTGRIYRMTEADAVIRSPSLDEVLVADGAMRLEDRPATFEASLSTPRSLAESQVADLSMSVTIGENAVSATGRLGEAMSYAGKLEVDAPQLRDLITLSGADVPEGPGFERLALSGTVTGSTEKLTLAEGTQVTFDDISGTGNVTIDMTGTRPAVSGTFRTDRLDLAPYVPNEGPAERDVDAAFPEWSEAPIDLSALQTADADLSISAGEIVFPTVSVGPSDARLVLREGRMTMTLARMALYGGNGEGTLTVDAGAATPTVAARFGLTGVGAQAFLADLIGTDRLTGTGDVRIDVATAGTSQAAFVRNLSGDVATELSGGAVRGVNLGKIARSALSVADQLREGGVNVANLTASLQAAAATARAPGEATDFSELLVDLSIEGGVVTTDALRITGPYYAVIGEGAVNLPNQTMRMTLAPRVSAADGQPLRELIAPILVSGTFSDPKIGVDARPLAEGIASDKVRGLLGRAGIETGDDAGLEETVREGARQELGRLLGGKDQETSSTAGADGTGEDAEPAPSARDDLIERGLGAVFGRPRTQADEADEPDEQAERAAPEE